MLVDAVGCKMNLRQRLRQRQLAVLNDTRIASPCNVSWDGMKGDDKVRFCPDCALNVYNLSAMDVEEAAEVLASTEERLCLRFYRRADGTILTRDCPVGAQTREQRRVNRVWEAVTAAGLSGIIATIAFPTQGAYARPAAQRRALQCRIRADQLHLAAKEGRVADLKRKLHAGAPVDTLLSDGATPLMTAAENGKTEAVRLLLEHHADLHRKDRQGRTALDRAAAAGHSKVVAVLQKFAASHPDDGNFLK
jgi:hypothetical protein